MQNTPATSGDHKIRREHQDRLAIVYVRQSTVHQVQHHQESTKLQYGLVEQAQKLGWRAEQIVVIDDDLGLSGASADGRQGFQRLLSEIALNNVGLILGVEMSRLARSCKDWYQLLELCALFRTLIADLDGMYDPTSYNDRLLLGLKGTMSEAELHVIKQRMLQGALQKARRGELVTKVPIGYVRSTVGEVQLDPDEEVQSFVRLVFEQFQRIGSASGVLRWLVEHDVRMPVRADTGPEKGEIQWRRPHHCTLRNMLTHPMYAGAYVYGRTCQNPTTRRVRQVTQRLAPEQWQVLLKDRYPAYVSWSQHEQNVAQLQENRALTSRRGAVREGRALLAGLLVCGRCQRRLSVRYRSKASQPRYLCDSARSNYGEARCQSVCARILDHEAVRLALAALTPAALEVSVQVADDIHRQREQLESHWRQRLERARYEADRLRRQYNAVEPENRLVARSLEQAWEEKLCEVEQLERDFERYRREQPQRLTADEIRQIQRLAEDLPTLWHAADTTDEDRKVILRQLIERIVVDVEGESEWVELKIHWAGGQQTYSRIRRPISGTRRLSRWPELAALLRELKDKGLRSHEIAAQLQADGHKPAKGNVITAEVVRLWMSRFGLAVRRNHSMALADSEWTIPDVVDRFGIPASTVYGWIRRGDVSARQEGGSHGRWIVQATERELAELAKKRRGAAPHLADSIKQPERQSARITVNGGVV